MCGWPRSYHRNRGETLTTFAARHSRQRASPGAWCAAGASSPSWWAMTTRVSADCSRDIGAGALVSSSRRWTGQKIDHPVRVVNASRAASPAVEFPDGPSAGLHTQIVQRSGMTARMPPPTPLFPGNPTR
jgi:hypothetical protein